MANYYDLHEESILVFTHKTVDFMLSINGSTSWKLDLARASKCKYVICCKNYHHPQVRAGEPPHHAAFLIGEISSVVDSSTNEIRGEDRYTIKFDKFAEVGSDESGKWNRAWANIVGPQRTPIKYFNTDLLTTMLIENGININELEFTTCPSEDWSFAQEYLNEENKFILGKTSAEATRDNVKRQIIDYRERLRERVRGSKHVLESVKEPNIKRTEEGITIKEAKERLSIEYAIPEDSIEIILKG